MPEVVDKPTLSRKLTLAEKLEAWHGNMNEVARGVLDFDYANAYEGSFFRGDPEEAVEWLEENFPTWHEEFGIFCDFLDGLVNEKT